MYQPVRAGIDRYKSEWIGTGGTSQYGPVQNPKRNKSVPISLSYRNVPTGTGTKLITLTKTPLIMQKHIQHEDKQ